MEHSRPQRGRARAAFALAAAAVLLASCSSAGDTAEAPNDTLAFTEQSLPPRPSTTLIAEAPEIDLDEADQAFVDFESAWLCEIQKVSFATQAAQGEAQTDMMSDFGIDEAGYAEFRLRVEGDQDLREAIQYTYQESCIF